jgi:hypothetical protein
MWTEVVFEDANASNGIAMAHELRSAGLTLDKDFTWQYIPSGIETFKRQVIINFRNPALATFYSLKWQK